MATKLPPMPASAIYKLWKKAQLKINTEMKEYINIRFFDEIFNMMSEVL